MELHFILLIGPIYIPDILKEKKVNYDLCSCKVITQPKFNSETHGQYSLGMKVDFDGQCK